jgi:GNAT superfamily N-acetyltransferase
MGEVVVRRFGRPGDLGWVVAAHGELYQRELGWTADFETLVARIVTDFAARYPVAPTPRADTREAGWIAELDGSRVGCVFCMAADDTAGKAADAADPADPEHTAQLRVLLVDPAARGLGLGSRLVDDCLAFAVAAGYRHMVLWTTDRQATATAVYLSRGFTLVHEEPLQAYGDAMTSQIYRLDLPAGR